MLQMVATKHCCWGECKSDSRFPHLLHPALKKRLQEGKIFEESGILKHINPYDIILADRGFTVQDLLNPLQAKLMIPAFLKGRKNLSAAEELSTRKIAKARIHIERFNQR